MNHSVPPPLPRPETALGTYLKAIATILPALIIWIFSNVILLPRLQLLWERANLTNSKAQWLMDASHFLGYHFWIIGVVIVMVFVALELSVRSWPRYRRLFVSLVAVTFHTIVLLGLVAISTAALLAAPIHLSGGQ